LPGNAFVTHFEIIVAILVGILGLLTGIGTIIFKAGKIIFELLDELRKNTTATESLTARMKRVETAIGLNNE
jgi:hypothetical protein